MEITAITPQAKDKTRCSIYVDGRFYCGLTLETTVKNRLKVGQNVTAEYLSEIQLESEKRTALDKALTHITATQKTEREIRSFLTKKGYLPATVEYVLEKLRGYDFVNDGQYAKAYVSSKSKKKGERLIELELRAKGISEEDVGAALSEIDESSQIEAAKSLLEKYLRAKTLDAATLQKGYRYLLSKGFSYEVARAALSALKGIEEMEDL